jgi:hypothetical protein
MGEPDIWRVVSTVVGGLVMTLVGYNAHQLRQVLDNQERMNGKFFSHVTDPHLHYSALTKAEEHRKHIENKADVAHQRLDHIEQRRTG